MSNNPANAIELLKMDHEKLKKLFEAYEGLGVNAKEHKQEIADEICWELTLHSMLEEQIFYPTIREEIGDEDGIVKESIVEHGTIKTLISEIGEMTVDEEIFDAKIKVLKEQVEHHVQEEEEEMFPMAQNSSLDLEKLKEEMISLRDELESEDEF